MPLSGAVFPDLVSAKALGDGRPHDVEMPAPQQAELLIVSEDDLIRVPISIAYALNPEYDPENEAWRN
jgi:hypothetical protein